MELENINLTTILALFGWPLVAMWLYSTRPVGQATILTILGGFLLLPPDAFVKIKMIPEFDKDSIPSLAAFVMCMVVTRRTIRLGNGFGKVEFFLLALFITPFVTSLMNSDPLVFRDLKIPGLGFYDAGSTIIRRFVLLIPFFLGRQLLRGPVDNEDILRMLVAGGLIYSLPMLFEVRMSPQLNYWIYGTVVRDFIQEVRAGGFRPVVFLGHGLHTAFFAMTTVVAAAALWRSQPRLFRAPTAAVVGYLGVVLALCKSAAPIVYAAFLMPLVRWATPRIQMRVALALVMIALSYPILRTADLVPTSAMLQVARQVSPDRAISLGQRFRNEQALLQHASHRFWFGWGRFGRSRVRKESGVSVVNPDGYWIITLGQFGFIGFLAIFGLLGLSVFRAASALKFAESKRDANYLAALTLIIAVSVVNLLPNSDIFPWTWLFVGALVGRAEALRAAARQSVKLQRPMRVSSQAP